VKGNASLCQVVARSNWLDDDDQKKLICFSARNQVLAQWIDNPNVVSKAAWPEYLAVAQETGQDTVFCILQVLTPCLGEQRRKCRCPDFYVPS
jgi:hypothetical protein